MIQSVDVRDSVADVADDSYLLLLRLEVKIFDLAFQDGDDALQTLSLRGLRLLQTLLYLIDSSFIRPVIFFSVNGKYEAAAKGRIFFFLEINFLCSALFPDKFFDPCELLLARSCHIAQGRLYIILMLRRPVAVCLADIRKQGDRILIAEQLQKAPDLGREYPVDDVVLCCQLVRRIREILHNFRNGLKDPLRLFEHAGGDAKASCHFCIFIYILYHNSLSMQTVLLCFLRLCKELII